MACGKHFSERTPEVQEQPLALFSIITCSTCGDVLVMTWPWQEESSREVEPSASTSETDAHFTSQGFA